MAAEPDEGVTVTPLQLAWILLSLLLAGTETVVEGGMVVPGDKGLLTVLSCDVG
jgi:hypothetical protein